MLRSAKLFCLLLTCSALSSLSISCGDDTSNPAQPIDAGGSETDAASDVTTDALPPTPMYGICSGNHWCWESPYPQGNDLMGIWGTSPSDFWAVGATGTLIHYDGTGWSNPAELTRLGLNAVWGSSATDLWVVGDHGTILHYDGKTWSRLMGEDPASDPSDAGVVDAEPGKATTTANLYAVAGLGPQDIWVAGAEGALLHYDGKGWTGIDTGSKSTLRTVWASSPTNVWVGGDQKTLRRYDGTTWKQESPGADILSIHGSDKNNVWCVGYDGYAVQFTGATFAGVATPTKGALRVVRVESAWSAWAAGDGGTVLRWNGKWEARSTATTNSFAGAWSNAPNQVTVVGANGVIQRWDENARTDIASGTSHHYMAVAGSGPDDVWVAGDGMQHRSSAGWGSVDKPTPRALYGMWVNGKSALAVGTDGTILSLGSTGWQSAKSPTTEWLHAVWSRENKATWAVGSKGTILGLLNGSEWIKVPSGTDATIADVWGFDSDEVWAVTDMGSILRSSGAKWEVLPSAPDAGISQRGLRSVWGNSKTDAWAVGDARTILHYDGSLWSSFAAKRPDGHESLNDVWGASTDDVWCVGSAGTLLHWNGSSWTEMSAGTARTLHAIWGSSKDQVWAVGEKGTILRYRP